MQKTRVTVQVAGQTLNLCGTEDETNIRKVAAYLDENVKTIGDKNPALSTNMCLLLASLNITEELFNLRQQYEQLNDRISELRSMSAPARPQPVAEAGPKKVIKAPIKHPFEQDVSSSTK
ncbi:cell division protein ZapA [Christensenellaceae bacterium OttesenSCG-928-M15]|nr:cell division protein ZapA [Christensenellaceae bacterium OttesenSCG-928-M15]